MMMDSGKINLLFEEIVETGLIDAVAKKSETQWALSCAGGKLPAEVFLNSDGVLTLQSRMPAPSKEKLVSTYEIMLKLNVLDNGLRFAKSDSQISLEVDLPVSGMNLEVLEDALKTFITQAVLWKVAMQNGGIEADSPEADDLFGGLEEGMLRI